MTSRGGRGFPPELIFAELEAVFGAKLRLLDERGPGWCQAEIDLEGDELKARASRCGLLRAVLSVKAADDDEVQGQDRPWPVGVRVRAGRRLRFEEVFVAPSLPEGREAGARRHRHLSPVDARVVANLCGLADGASVLEPCAGRGTLLRALEGRGLEVQAFDVDGELGWAQADMRALPLDDETVDGVVFEPPYRTPGVLDEAWPELARVLRPEGKVALLVPRSWSTRVTVLAAAAGIDGEVCFTWWRHELEVVLWLGARALTDG